MEKDIFRDSWVRYLGYANEVGEAFRALVPVGLVRASYALAFTYVFADTADKSIKMHKSDGRVSKVLVETGDALLWQTLASVAIPGYTINRLCHFTQYFLKRRKLPPKLRNWLTVGVGLSSIPFIVHPIDSAVTVLMDETYRKLFMTSHNTESSQSQD